MRGLWGEGREGRTFSSPSHTSDTSDTSHTSQLVFGRGPPCCFTILQLFPLFCVRSPVCPLPEGAARSRIQNSFIQNSKFLWSERSWP
ncbi:MAG: hypothetical protein F6J93_02280 [Oscillatoria sp. SIO1A7]|nr:hypothetical protein [Oscillatoria sp. SIO1A7]